MSRTTLCCILLFFAYFLQGQPNIQLISEDAYYGDSVRIDLKVTSFNRVGSIQFSLLWDETILNFLNKDGLLQEQGVTYNTNNYLTLAWYHSAASGLTLEDDTIILSLYFEVVGQIGATTAISLTNSPVRTEIAQIQEGQPKLVPFSEVVSESIQVKNPILLQTDLVPPSCYGGDDGAIFLSIENLNDYQVHWSSSNDFEQTDLALEFLSAGDYYLRISNEDNILFADTVFRIENINQPLLLDEWSVNSGFCDSNNYSLEIKHIKYGTPPFSYALNNGEFKSEGRFSNLSVGDYLLTIIDDIGCQIDTLIIVEETRSDYPILIGDSIIQQGDETEISIHYSFDFLKIQWFKNGQELENENEQLLRITPQQTSEYKVQVTDSNGCDFELSTRVLIIQDRSIYIPNAFSPNGDGQNDYFYIKGGQNVKVIHSFQIFNRSGLLIYQANPSELKNNPEWDGMFNGNSLPTDVYVFRTEIEFLDGHKEVITGDITLLK